MCALTFLGRGLLPPAKPSILKRGASLAPRRKPTRVSLAPAASTGVATSVDVVEVGVATLRRSLSDVDYRVRSKRANIGSALARAKFPIPD